MATDTRSDVRFGGLADAELLELHRRMVLLRTYDERSVVYHRQGRIGTYAIYWNHEAIQAGATFALGDDDWIFPSYRESAIGLVRGMPVETILQWWRGHPSGWWSPADWNVASISVPIASHVPHAAGLAWGKKLRGENVVAMAFFGDGATSEGEFHEGVNLAAVMNAPAVFVCNNNRWAISTPLEAQTRAESLADKAVGYGIPGVTVDGLDVLAVYGAARDRRRPARLHRSRPGGGGARERRSRPLRAAAARRRGADGGAVGGGAPGSRGPDARRDRGGRSRGARRSRAPVHARLCRPAGEHAQWLS
jgi:pyruvate dehydrogenase E1 component alpha subunit